MAQRPLVLVGTVLNTAAETKAKAHVFRQREMSLTHVGPERRTSTSSPPVIRNGHFGFSLMLWRSRRRPRCRCLKSLIDHRRRQDAVRTSATHLAREHMS